MTDWKDIATCPANVNVLFFNGTDVIPGQKKQYTVGPFRADMFYKVDRPAREITNYEDYTDADRDGGYGDVYPEPTHWQPMPAPPYVTVTIDGDASEVIDLKVLSYGR